MSVEGVRFPLRLRLGWADTCSQDPARSEALGGTSGPWPGLALPDASARPANVSVENHFKVSGLLAQVCATPPWLHGMARWVPDFCSVVSSGRGGGVLVGNAC